MVLVLTPSPAAELPFGLLLGMIGLAALVPKEVAVDGASRVEVGTVQCKTTGAMVLLI
jgi:hypothetical protein